MKKILLILLVPFLMATQCEDDNNPVPEDTIIGRWHVVGFENTVMYEFTDNLRYTIYSTDGNFGSLETAIPNPDAYSYEGDNLVIDLSFGNFLIAAPIFKCNGNVVDLVSESGTTTLFREDYPIDNCNE